MTKPAQSVELREPEWLARVETVLEVLNEGVVIADGRPRILFTNSRFVEMIGIPAVELIGFDLPTSILHKNGICRQAGWRQALGWKNGLFVQGVLVVSIRQQIEPGQKTEVFRG